MLVCTIHPWRGNVSPVAVTVSQFEQQLHTNFFSKPCKSTAEIVSLQSMVVTIYFICRVKPVQRSRITKQGVQWHANVKEQKKSSQSAQSLHQINGWLKTANKTGISYGYIQNIATVKKQLTPAPLQCGLSYLPCSATVLKSQNATTPQPPFSPDVTHATFGSSQESRLGSKVTVFCP